MGTPKNTATYWPYAFVPIAFLLLFTTQCAPTRRGFVANQYHNITSHYNCWFIAKEHLKQVEADLATAHQNNFTRTLQVFPTIDSAVIKSDTLKLADAIKKASLGITRHPYSNWTDDNYLIVGQTRLLQADFGNAIETFKYINTQSEDDNARHSALIYLMRTFIEAGELGNAISVSDFLAKESLNKENRKLLALTRAHLYQKREEPLQTVEHLVEAAPMMRRAEGRARIYFIIGQLYQLLEHNTEAYRYYDKCVKDNPEYELFFYARLNMNQVATLEGSADLKRVRKYYQKLLKDEKNVDFRDKIYYEMGRFEQKQENLDLAVDHYKSSAASSTNNPRQKSYAFWELGKIYFDQLKDYAQAKAYYDSTVLVMPKDEEAFASIEQRQKVLAEFVEHVTTIAQTDSLIALANLDSISQLAVFKALVDQEEAAAEQTKKEERRRARRAAAAQGQADLNPPGTGTFAGGPQAGREWYFYNTSTIARGTNEFRTRWGNRKLENNWRRSNKPLEEGGGDAIVDNTDEASETNEATPSLSPEEKRAARYAELRNSLPISSEDQLKAYSKLEFAYYRLGKIYRVDLEEPLSAIPPFKTLLARFDTSSYAPEVLYQLYLIFSQADDIPQKNYYKDALINQYPHSIYAKVIINPNYQAESNAATAKAQALYRKAYEQYQANAWSEAGVLVQQGLTDFPENDFTDNFRLLRILIEAEESPNIYTFRFALEEFKKEFPESELVEYAERLLKGSQSVEARIKKSEAIRYRERFDQTHYFVLVYNVNNAKADQITQQVSNFNDTHFPNAPLFTSSLILNETYNLVLVNQFPNREDALQYYQAFIKDEGILNGLQQYNFHNFVITKDNFNIYQEAQEPESYKSFFQKHYLRLDEN